MKHYKNDYIKTEKQIFAMKIIRQMQNLENNNPYTFKHNGNYEKNKSLTNSY